MGLSSIIIKDENGNVLSWQEFKKKARIRKSDTVRVYPNGDYKMFLFGRWQNVQRVGHYAYWTKKWFDEHYKDERHKGLQGRGYVEWRNGDFAEPFTADLIAQNMP